MSRLALAQPHPRPHETRQRNCPCSPASRIQPRSSFRDVTAPSPMPGFLLLEDGTLFRGTLVNAAPPSVAEVVFTTNMTGYQEVFTDPSYRGQIVVMTSPM